MSEHNISIFSRKHMEISGAVSVLSFDDEQVVLKTTMGLCCVRGNELTVSKLDCDGGEVFVDVQICSVYYPEQSEEKRSVFSKIFK